MALCPVQQARELINNILGAQAHLQLGEALQPLRDEGVAVICSGMSFHNMQAFFGSSAAQTSCKQAAEVGPDSIACPNKQGPNKQLFTLHTYVCCWP